MIRATAPGRLCLFGEHLDYLGLPVIAAAIDLRMRAAGGHRAADGWAIHKPDLSEEDRFPLSAGEIPYSQGEASDFLRAAVNVLRRDGVNLPGSAEFEVSGRVPIRAGASSSSALQVAWVAALLSLAGDPRAGDAQAIALLAHRSEVTEFRGAGGMMDQFTSALGGLLRIDPGAPPEITRLPSRLGSFVLGDSREPKDTQGVLSRVQGAARRGAKWLEREMGIFDWAATPLSVAHEVARAPRAPLDDLRVTLGALRNLDLLKQGEAVLTADPLDHLRFGCLLTEHHSVLRDSLGISTPKIDRMLQAALDAGALGGKINGSGGGGCMFAYAPENPDAVADALRAAGGEAWVVEVAPGVEVSRV